MPDRAGGDTRCASWTPEGEPTRDRRRVAAGGSATMAERRDDLRRNADHVRRGVV
jgi:hypothetical protein